MRKKVTLILTVCIIFFALLTSISLWGVMKSSPHFPEPKNNSTDQLRIVLITKNQSTDFWQQVEKGAKEQAQKENVLVEVLTSFGTEDEDFNRNLETAIYSKVDGIIIQGQDTNEFKELTKIKAAFYGVPIITVGEDVPAEESLRKTYVGSDQKKAGELLASHLIEKVDETGEVIVMTDEKPTFMQKQRLEGVKEAFKRNPNLKIVEQGMGHTKDEVMNATMNRMNLSPNATAWILLNAEATYFVTQEISKRTQVNPFMIYTFDDAAESEELLRSGVIDGLLRQQPKEMGKRSVQLLVEWINGETVPLDSNGYYTSIQLEESVK